MKGRKGKGERKNKFDLNHNSNVVILCENSYICEVFSVQNELFHAYPACE